MATLAEQLVGSGLQSSQQAPDLAGAISQGAQLGLHIQGVEMERQKLEQAKQQQYVAKVEKIASLYDTAAKLPPKAQGVLFNKVIPKTRDALGLQKEFPDESLQMFNASPEVVGYLRDQVRDRKLSFGDMMGHLQDQQWIADHIPKALQEKAGKDLTPIVTDEMDNFQKDTQFATEEKDKNTNAQLVQIGQNQRQGQQISSAGNVEVAKKVAADYAKFKGDGGLPALDNKINKLQRVFDSLNDGSLKTGAVTSALPVLGSDKGQAILNPKLKAAQDNVRSAISLKQSLDSQFSAAEAAQAFGRSFDPTLPTEANKQKVGDLLNELKANKASALETFRQQGFKVGETPKVPPDKAAAFKKLSPAAQEIALPGLAGALGMSIEDAKKALGIK